MAKAGLPIFVSIYLLKTCGSATLSPDVYGTTTNEAESNPENVKDVCSQLANRSQLEYRGLEMFNNATMRIIGFPNVSASVGMAIDLKNDIYILWDDISGAAIVVDIARKRAVELPPNDVLLQTNNYKDLDYESHLTTIPSLEEYFSRRLVPEARHLNITEPPPTSVVILGDYILEQLIGGPIPGQRQNRFAGVDLSNHLAQTFAALFNGPLRPTLPLFHMKRANGNVCNVIEALMQVIEIFIDEFSDRFSSS